MLGILMSLVRVKRIIKGLTVSMLVYLNASKQEKEQQKQASIMSSQLHFLTHFNNISALMGGTTHLIKIRILLKS